MSIKGTLTVVLMGLFLGTSVKAEEMYIQMWSRWELGNDGQQNIFKISIQLNQRVGLGQIPYTKKNHFKKSGINIALERGQAGVTLCETKSKELN